MNSLPASQLISTPELAAPLAVLLLASINAMLENNGQAARNAITIAKSALFAAVLSLTTVLLAGPYQLVLATFEGATLSFGFDLLPTSLLLTVSFASLLIARGTVVHEAATPLKDSIARWNIAVLFTASGLFLSGHLAAVACGCVIAVAGFFKAQVANPGVLQGRVKTLA